MGKKVRNIITSILVAIAVAIAVSMLIIKISGGGVYTILSGSMEPVYHVGSMLYVKPVAKEDLKVGDAITFAISEDTTVTHRIAQIREDDGTISYVTKGDANETIDGAPVIYENIIGKPVFSVPFVGYVIDFIKTPYGLVVSVSAVALLIFLGILFGEKKSNNNNNDKIK